MDGYLLDTNVLIPLVRPKHKHTEIVKRWLERVPGDAPIFLSVAAIAELFVGPMFGGGDVEEVRREIEAVIKSNGFSVLAIDRHVAAEYGNLKARLMLKYDRKGKPKPAKWPENWELPERGSKLGIDELDLLMIAQALQRRLMLVTNDEMRRIREGLDGVAPELEIENRMVPV